MRSPPATWRREIVGVFSDKPDGGGAAARRPGAALERRRQDLSVARGLRCRPRRRGRCVRAGLGRLRRLHAHPRRRLRQRASAAACSTSTPRCCPSTAGLRTHARALADGEREHGASVHFVIPELDAGTVIAQAVVPVLAGDDADSAGRPRARGRTSAAGGACCAWPLPAAWLNAGQRSPSTVIRCLRHCA